MGLFATSASAATGTSTVTAALAAGAAIAVAVTAGIAAADHSLSPPLGVWVGCDKPYHGSSKLFLNWVWVTNGVWITSLELI